MSVISLKVQSRQAGKKSAKQLRKKGLIPGVFYYKNNSVPIYSDPLSLRPIVYTSSTRIIELEIEGVEKRECILRDVVFDPVSDNIMHFDLMGIKRGFQIHVEVPIILRGQPEGIKQGGLLQQVLRKVAIKCQPKDLPEHIELDITNLRIGHHLTLADTKSENIEFDVPLDTVVCSVIPPRVAEETTKPAEVAVSETTDKSAVEGKTGEGQK